MYCHLLLMLSVVVLAKQGSQLINDESENCYGCLEADNVKCKADAIGDQVTDFIKDENCWYQQFLDRLQELDCMLETELKTQSYADESLQAELWQQMMIIRDEIYDAKKIIKEKICNDCETNDTFEKYASCWKTYWLGMREKVEKRIADMKTANSGSIFADCSAYGTQHQKWCVT